MTLTPHSIINGDACFAYFNKIWGIPRSRRSLMDCTPSLERQSRNTSYARLYSLIFR